MMKSSLYIFIVIIFYCFQTCTTDELPEDWIDPYDMSPSKDYLKFSDSSSSLHAQFTDKSVSCNTIAEIYFRRTINMLLNSVHEDFIDPDLYSGHLFFKIDSEKYAFLKSFADGASGADLEQIDKILVDIFNKPTHKHLQEHLESWFHKCLNIILSREGIISIIVMSYGFVLFKLFRENFNSMRVVKFLLINFLLFDFVFTWVHLYQKTQSESLANKIKYKELPIECDPQNMNSWQFLTNFFSKDDECKKYYEVKYTDIFYKVTPGTVLTEMFARTIHYPAKSIGKAFGELSFGIYDSFPWPLNIIILPIALFFFCIMTCITMSLIFDKEMKFSLFPFFSFSFGGQTMSRNTQDTISGNNLERLLNITQNRRQLIEEIQPQDIDKQQDQSLQQIEDSKTIKKEENAQKNDEIKIGNTKESEIEEKVPAKTRNDDKIEEKTEFGSGDHK